MQKFNASDFTYRATITAIQTHRQNALQLDIRSRDTRYPANQREVFAKSALDEQAEVSKLTRMVEYYRENGFWPVEKIAA